MAAAVIAVLGFATANPAVAYVTDSQAHVAIDAGGALTPAAQAWIKSFSSATEQRWADHAGGLAAADIQSFKNALVGQFLPWAGLVIGPAPGQVAKGEVCATVVTAGCWYLQRDDHDLVTGSPSMGWNNVWTVYPFSAAPYAFPDIDGKHDIIAGKYNGSAFAVSYTQSNSPNGSFCGVDGATWLTGRVKIAIASSTRGEQCYKYPWGYNPSWRGVMWKPAEADVMRTQADDPSIPNSAYTVPYSSNWAVGVAQALAAYSRVRDWIGHELQPAVVDNPYHNASEGPQGSDSYGPGGAQSGFGNTKPNVPHCSGADPVACATGNFSESYIDLSAGGLGLGLNLTRTYNAQLAAWSTGARPFGYGWDFGYGQYLTVDGDGAVTVHHEDGSTAWFRPNGDGSYWTPAFEQSTLTKNANGTFTYVRPNQVREEFTGAGRLTTVSDANNNATTLGYDGSGQLTTITDPSGSQITLAHNADGTISSATDPAGHQVSYTYSSGNLTQVTDVRGGHTSFSYDGSHRMLTVTDPAGKVITTNVYDTSNRVVSQTDAMSRVTLFDYGTPGHTKITTPDGKTKDERFDNGVPVSVTQATGTASARTVTTSYDAGMRPVSTTDANGHTWTYTYNSRGDRTSATDPQNHTTSWTYDAQHHLTSATTPMGHQTTYGYDSHGNLTTVSRQLGAQTATTTNSYDSHGLLTATTDPLQHTWSYSYDSRGNRTSATDPSGHTTTATYDAAAHATSTTSARGNEPGATAADYTTHITRDAAGNPTDIQDPYGQHTVLGYDADGRLTDQTDRDARHSTTVYNDAGQVTEQHRPDGVIQATGYDTAGRMSSQTDGLNHVTHYTYDALGQVASSVDPLGRTTTYGYDANGNQTTVTDPAGHTTTTSYDTANKPTAVSYQTGNPGPVSFTYNADGLRTGTTDDTGTSTYSYDAWGRLTSHTSGAGQTTTYAYDLADRLTSIGYPDAIVPHDPANTSPSTVAAGSVTRSYTPAGKLSAVTDWLGNTTSFTYDADANLTSTVRPNTTSGQYTYDRNGQLTGLLDVTGNTTLGRSNEGLLTSGPLGTLTGQSFAYDPAQRLTSAGAASYSYDAADNPTQTLDATGQPATQAFDAANELTQITQGTTTTSLTYNQRGERTATADNHGVEAHYTWNQAGQLTGYSGPDRSQPTGTTTQAYSYDADANRQTTTAAGIERNHAYDLVDGLPLIIEDGATAYITGPSGLPIEQITSNGLTRYYSSDQLGSTTALTDANGNTLTTYTYDAYGNTTTNGTATNPFQYAGQYTDPETGLQYLRARYYQPATTQFLSRDPAVATTRAPYTYAANSPTNATDPTGLISLSGVLSGISQSAAAFLDGVSGGLSTQLAGSLLGFDPECLDFNGGYQALQGIGFLASFATGEGEAALAARGEGALSRLGRRLADERGEFDPSAFRRPRPGSGKGRASDVPSWVRNHPDGRPLVGESGKDFARRLLDKRYGEGNWSGTGPGSEYNQIKKYGDRGFE